jgi:hypothetical protein
MTGLSKTGSEMAKAAKGFSLTIRADHGSTMLETDVDYMHPSVSPPNQGFTRLFPDRKQRGDFRDVRATAIVASGEKAKGRGMLNFAAEPTARQGAILFWRRA